MYVWAMDGRWFWPKKEEKVGKQNGEIIRPGVSQLRIQINSFIKFWYVVNLVDQSSSNVKNEWDDHSENNHCNCSDPRLLLNSVGSRGSSKELNNV